MKRTPLKRKTRLRPMSTKRQREAKIYSQKRKAFLEDRPECEAYGIIMLNAPINTLYLGRGYSIPVTCPASTDIHHVHGRVGSAYLDEGTWLAVSRWAHRWIHDNPKIARQLRLLA